MGLQLPMDIKLKFSSLHFKNLAVYWEILSLSWFFGFFLEGVFRCMFSFIVYYYGEISEILKWIIKLLKTVHSKLLSHWAITYSLGTYPESENLVNFFPVSVLKTSLRGPLGRHWETLLGNCKPATCHLLLAWWRSHRSGQAHIASAFPWRCAPVVPSYGWQMAESTRTCLCLYQVRNISGAECLLSLWHWGKPSIAWVFALGLQAHVFPGPLRCHLECLRLAETSPVPERW